MLQIKTIIKEIDEIDNEVNAFLATIPTESVVSVETKARGFVVVLYEVKELWSGRLCCDCQYWDDCGSVDSVSGLCQEHGGRRRFNCKACDRFKDIRR